VHSCGLTGSAVVALALTLPVPLSRLVARIHPDMVPAPHPPVSFFFLLLIFSTLLFSPALAQVAIPRFIDCFTGNAALKLNISTVYAQITTSESLGRHLNLTLLGNSPQVIEGTANGSSDLGACPLLLRLVSPRA
jgi:hypothetical protein